MNNALSLPPLDDLDTQMLKVARNLAQDMHTLPDILKHLAISQLDFDRWQRHPRFLEYLKSEREAWTAAANTPERTKLKAAIVMESFMEQAHAELHDRKTPLNQRVELGKLVSRLAGMGEPKGIGVGGVGGGFNLQINIGPGVDNQINVRQNFANVIESIDDTGGDPPWEDDGYDPLSSPDTLEDM